MINNLSSTIKNIQEHITYFPFHINISGKKITIEKQYIFDNDQYYTRDDFIKKYNEIGSSVRIKQDIILSFSRLLQELDDNGIYKKQNIIKG